MSLATLRNIQVPLPNGRTAPLSQFATFESAQGYPVVWRRDRVPTLTVQANVKAGALPETVVADKAKGEGYRGLSQSYVNPIDIIVIGSKHIKEMSQIQEGDTIRMLTCSELIS